MSKIKNGLLDQYGAEPFERQQFGTAGVEGVKCRAVERLSFLIALLTALIFTVRLHVMQRTVLLSQFCLSVCLSVRLSVRPSDACIVTKLNNALRIF